MEDKILIVGPAWIGDMVMAQTLFMLLKQNRPDCSINVIAPPWSLPLLERMPEVNKSIVLPIKHGQLKLYQRYRFGKNLREERYQQAIILPNSFKSALIPYWAKIPLRTGWLGEYRYGLLNDIRHLNKTKYPLMIDRFMVLALSEKEQSLPLNSIRPHLTVDYHHVLASLEKFHLNTTHKLILALCPGAEFGPTKRWPEEYFAEVAKTFLHQGWQVWLFGSHKDLPHTQKIMQLTRHQCVNLAGKTSLAEAIDLLSTVDAVASNDSGLMHIANALNRPTVVIYGSSSPVFTPPLNDKAKVLTLNLSCSPCFKRTCKLKHLNCLKMLKPEYVIRSLSELVNL